MHPQEYVSVIQHMVLRRRFTIGAHAVIGASALVTLDAISFERNFPELRLT